MGSDAVREMRVRGVSRDKENQAVLVLETLDGKRLLPMSVGMPEAAGISMELNAVRPARPMTHDFFKEALDHLGVRMACATMLERRESIIYAQVTLTRDGTEVNVDARPSDAVALAVRTGASIFATAQLLDEDGLDAAPAGQYV